MIITCNKCSTSFNLDDSLVLEGGSKCRCTVCKNIFTAYPLSRKPEPEQSEPLEMEQTSEELSDTDFEADLDFEANTDFKSDMDFESDLDFEADLEDEADLDFEADLEDDPVEKKPSLEMEEPNLSSKDSDIEPQNSFLDTNIDDLESDEDFSFNENTFDMEEESSFKPLDVQKNYLESEDKDIESEPIEPEDKDIEFETIEFEDEDFAFDPVQEELVSSFDDPAPLTEQENEESIISSGPEQSVQTETKLAPEKKFPQDDENLETQEIDPPPKREKKVIVKPKPMAMAAARPEPLKKKKMSFLKIIFIILMLVFLLAIGAYIASVITGYKLPVIEQYLKKPAPEISEARPIPNQKSVNGRFITNATAGTLFVITGRVENPSNIAYSHIEIRGALITTNKEEAKIKKAFCGNIIPEEILKTGNITDIDILLTLKEGAHNINVNVPPGASVPFMVVFSDLPEKLENFTVKVAGFDKAINTP